MLRGIEPVSLIWIDLKSTSYQSDFIWPCCFKEEVFSLTQAIRDKKCQCRSCLLTDRDKLRRLYNKPYINASYPIWFHLAQLVSEAKFEKIADGRQTLGELKKCIIVLHYWRIFFLFLRFSLVSIEFKYISINMSNFSSNGTWKGDTFHIYTEWLSYYCICG